MIWTEKVPEIHRFILLLLIAGCYSHCTFHRAKLNRLANDHKKPIANDHKKINEALRLNDDTLKQKTAVYSIESGGESLIARLWLFDHAEKSIDIQYYSFYNDVTGMIASDRLLRAADRGVKVRILIDDAASRMNSHEIRLLDSHENIEVRVYNAGLKLGSMDRRIKKMVKNGDRLLRRMHNKTLNVDDKLSMVGGRNVADRYFDFSRKYNFRDRELLLAGKIMDEIKGSFEKFWTSDLSVPYAKLSAKLNSKRYKDPSRFNELHHYAEGAKEFSDSMRARVDRFPELFLKISEERKLIWLDSVRFISDLPGKNEDRPQRKGGATTDSLVALIENAKNSIFIQSPYFITMEGSEDLLKKTIERGIKIKLLTNSLASTDNYEAFSAYQKCRKAISEMGIEINEFRPDANIRHELMIPEVQAPAHYKAIYGFHPKTIIIDSNTAAVGSYNFDPRSANYNTECIVVVRSFEFVKMLIKQFETELLPENSWQVIGAAGADRKAPLRKRLKTFFRRIIPKKLL